jgi:hypothetical protein
MPPPRTVKALGVVSLLTDVSSEMIYPQLTGAIWQAWGAWAALGAGAALAALAAAALLVLVPEPAAPAPAVFAEGRL